MTRPTHHVVWLRNDLRLHDHAALFTLTSHPNPPDITAVFILPEHWQKTDPQGLTRLGSAKARFLRECLADLQHRLNTRGIVLQVLYGHPVERLRHAYAIQPFHLHTAEAQAPEEARWLHGLADVVPITTYDVQTLFRTEQLKPLLNPACWPASYSAFVRWLEQQALTTQIDAPLPALANTRAHQAPRPDLSGFDMPLATPVWAKQVPASPFQGGEDAGLQHVHRYLWRNQAIRHYKHTRNQLCGEDFASQLSPWLAWGALSVRQVWADIRQWEHHYGASEHSAWLKKELLWREYFHWTLRVKGPAVFSNPNPTRFEVTRWQAWCEARTGYPVIDAGLRELIHTGYSANRMRQWLASFFIHQLGLDWRLGARFFEQHLIDADVASNWGNWAYIAGTGQDPRGGRYFHINKQLENHDPQLTHLSQWLPEIGRVTLAQIQAHQAGIRLLPHWPAPLSSAHAASGLA